METAYVLVLLGVLFQCCELILCRMARFCRCSSHWLFLTVAEGANFLPNFLGVVALATMPREHSASLWILYLIVLNNSMVAYDLEHKVKALLTASSIGSFIWHALSTAIHAGLGAPAYASIVAMVCASASCSIIVAVERRATQYCEEIAEYMRNKEHAEQGEADWNPSTLRGYRYIVEWESQKTVEQIFEQDDEEQHRKEKDLCLSFALFQLLFCIYRGIPCYNKQVDSLPKTRNLVLQGLLQQQTDEDDDQYRRGFRVVEVELGFLYDHIHGGYLLCSGASRCCYLLLVFVMATVMYVAGTVIYCSSEGAGHDSYEFIAPLLLHGFFDLLQILFYCGSDRQMVSYMCNPNAWHHHWFTRLVRHYSFKLMNRRWNLYWQDLLGQYSLLPVAVDDHPAAPASGGSSSTFPFLNWPTSSLYNHSAQQSAPVKLPPDLKAGIARALGGSMDDMVEDPNQELLPPSLEQLAQYFSPGGDSDGEHKVETILKWHIATCYCKILKPQEENVQTADQKVTTVLSRYCAYLVAFRPELLPCTNSSTTKHTFRTVLDDVASLVRDDRGRQLSRVEMLGKLDERVMSNTSSSKKQTGMVSDGLRLGHHLILDITDSRRLWKNLAKIWVKLILWAAPQQTQHASYASNHAKYLAQGGEFLTHLWAMLSHAGILEQSSWPPFISGGQVTPWVYPTKNNSG